MQSGNLYGACVVPVFLARTVKDGHRQVVVVYPWTYYLNCFLYRL